jgi:ubiquinone biosynthesis protein
VYFLNLVQEFKDFVRFEQIMVILIEEDLGHLLVDTKILHSLSWSDKILLHFSKDKKPSYNRLPRMFERLGPTFVKLGQVLSVRPDLLPRQYIDSLAKLQTDVSPLKFDVIKDVIEEEFGSSLEKIFKKFDKKPIASASIAQVHVATLKNGKKVAVKVKRPKVKQTFDTDTHIMHSFATLIEHSKPRFKKYKLVKLVNEFKRWIELETDFIQEAKNLTLFNKMYSKHPVLMIPKVYKRYCTENVIVMDYFDGIPINKLSKGYTKKKLHDILGNAFVMCLEQVFKYGKFHADPHPGNILVNKKGKIALVDFGIIGEFDDELKQQTLEMFYAILENHPDDLLDILLIMATDSDKVDYEQLQGAIRETIKELHKGDVSKIKVGEVFEKVLHAAVENGIRIPREFVLFAKSLVLIEGLALAYDPHFDVIEHSKPFIEKLIKQQFKEGMNMKLIAKKLFDSTKVALNIPKQASRVLKKLESGSISLNIQDTDIKRLAIEIDKSSNRIAYAAIIASFVVGGSLIMNINEFSLNPVSFLGFVFFMIAGIMGLALFHSIKKEEDMKVE